MKPDLATAAVSELIGTVLIAFFTALMAGNVEEYDGANGEAKSDAYYRAMYGSIGVGLVYTALTYALGHVSGGYFNPALTLVGFVFKRLDVKALGSYVGAQIGGAFVGVSIGSVMTTKNSTTFYNRVGFSFEESEAWLVEIIFAAILFHVYLLTVHPRPRKIGTNNSYFGMAYGFTFMGLSSAAAAVSGGVFNPAVGLAMTAATGAGGDLWYIYFFAPFVGAVLAIVVGVFTATRIPSSNRPYFHFGGALMFEFFHTAALVLVTALTVRPYFPSATSAAITNKFGPMVVGLFYGAQVYAGSFISGGHMNPAVSLGTYLSQKYFLARGDSGRDTIADPRINRWMQLVGYVVMQVAGAIIGALVAVRMVPIDVTATSTAFYPQLGDLDKFKAFAYEFLFGGYLVYLYLCTARAQKVKGNHFFGIVMGLGLLVAAYSYDQPGKAFGFNPASSIGLILAADADSADDAGLHTAIYLFAPLIGAVVATLFFRITNESEFIEDVGDADAQDAADDLEGQPMMEDEGFDYVPRGGLQLKAVSGPVHEFLGTFFFCLVVSCVGASTSTSSRFTPFAAASILAIGIYAGAHTSGGHLNPAVTFALFISRRGFLTWKKAAVYILLQVGGATLGAKVAEYLTGGVVALTPMATESNGDFLAFLAEYLFTFFLVYSVLTTATTRAAAGNSYFGLTIGFTVIAGGYSVGAYSGAGYNPAITTGTMFANGDHEVVKNIWIYLLAQFLAAATAVVVMYLTFERDVLGARSRQFDAIRSVVSEFIGTFFVVFAIGTVLAQTTANGGSGNGEVDLLASLCVGMTYMIVTHQARGVSGGHFNPVVTLAAVATGYMNMGVLDMLSYIASQFFGGIAGALAARSFYKFAPWVTDSNKSFRAFAGELICTIAITAVVLNTLQAKRQTKNSFFGIAIGAVYTAATFGMLSISESGFNPAVIGLIAANGSNSVGDDAYLYILAPLCGAVIATLFFVFTSRTSPATTKRW